MSDSEADVQESAAASVSRYRQFQSITQLQTSLSARTRRNRGGRLDTIVRAEAAQLQDGSDSEQEDVTLAESFKYTLLNDGRNDVLEKFSASSREEEYSEQDENPLDKREVQSASRQTEPAWSRHFFEILDPLPPSNAPRAKCLLCPEPAYHNNTRKQRAAGISAEAAARAAITHSQKLQEDRIINFGARTRRFSNQEPLDLKQHLLLLCHYIIKGLSFSTVDCTYFRQYHAVRNWAPPPSRKVLSGRLLDSLHHIVMEHMERELKEAQFFSLTTDAWTSDAQDKYVGVTVHFIDKNLRLKSHCLAVIPLEESHTWVNVTRAIAQRIQNHLPDTAALISTSTDNGANFLKVALALQTNLEIAAIDGLIAEDDWNKPVDKNEVNKETDWSGGWSCVAHSAQLCCLDVVENRAQNPHLGELTDLVERVRSMFKFIRASPGRRKIFRDIQRSRLLRRESDDQSLADELTQAVMFGDLSEESEDEVDEEYETDPESPTLKLPRSPAEYAEQRKRMIEKQVRPWMPVIDVPTRWMTVHAMLLRFVLLYEDIACMILGHNFDTYKTDEEGPLITPREVKTISCFVDVLAPLADFVRLSEGEHYVTMAWIPPLLAHVLQCIKPLERRTDEARVVRHMKLALRDSILKRLGYILNEPNMALAASALHPAFARLCFVSKEVRRQTWKLLHAIAEDFADEEHREQQPEIRVGYILPAVQEGDDVDRTLKRAKKALRRNTEQGISLSDAIKHAITCGLDPLEYWRACKANGGIDAILHLIKIVFCVQGTSAASERLFSGGGQSCSSLRSKIAEWKLEIMIVIQQYLRRNDDEAATIISRAIEKYLKETTSASQSRKRKRRNSEANAE